VYINDLSLVTDFFNFRLFADDSNLFHTFSARQHCIDVHEVNTNLELVQEWCFANRLTINSTKTNFMLLSSRRMRPVLRGRLAIFGKELQEVDVATFVGIHIDKHLTWRPHIEMVNKCIRKKGWYLV